MNFYKHHIGDYAAATAHLSWDEDQAFTRMLRVYYRDEKPLPVDLKAVQRLVGARSRQQKESVEAVLVEFFDLEVDGWHQARCDEEIQKANAQAEANRQVAQRREAIKRSTGNQRIVNESSTIRAENPVDKKHESFTGTCVSREPSQTPDSRQELSPPCKDVHTPPAAPAVAGQFEGHAEPRSTPNPTAPHAIALNRLGHRCTGMNPELVAFVAAGGTVEHLQQVAALPDCQGKPAAYVVKIARRELAEQAKPVTVGQLRNGNAPGKTMQALETLQRMKNELADDGNHDGIAEAPRALAGPHSRG